MTDNKHTPEDLKRLQSYDLGNKIQISIARIMEWYNRNDKKCYVSFSGGKDSTVLAWLAAQVCKLFDCKLILWFSDTGLEFPELREHVKTYLEWLKLTFHSQNQLSFLLKIFFIFFFCFLDNVSKSSLKLLQFSLLSYPSSQSYELRYTQ